MKIESGKIYHLSTMEMYDDFMNKAEMQGYIWQTGKLPSEEDVWDSYYESTCVRVIDGVLAYDHIDEYKHAYPQIVKYETGAPEQPKMPFKRFELCSMAEKAIKLVVNFQDIQCSDDFKEEYPQIHDTMRETLEHLCAYRECLIALLDLKAYEKED